MARPKILVTNDDGYKSYGLIVVAEALQALGAGQALARAQAQIRAASTPSMSTGADHAE